MTQMVHRLTNIDEASCTADCAGCGEGSSIIYKAHKGYWVCRIADSRRSPETRAKRRHRHNLRHRFAMSESDYQRMLKDQNGVCAICRNACSSGRRLAVDHDHETGRIRGLLCATCNRALGFFADDPQRLQRAAKYLTS